MSGDDKGYGLNVVFNSINSGYRLPLNQTEKSNPVDFLKMPV